MPVTGWKSTRRKEIPGWSSWGRSWWRWSRWSCSSSA